LHHALSGTLKDENPFVQGTQTAIWIATACVRVADACFLLGGGNALYESSPLQRRMRDLHAAAQHARCSNGITWPQAKPRSHDP
jgi:alkylation response protein AidB-like acyl-CoA dehydrogenase